jgi:flavorubredoxin
MRNHHAPLEIAKDTFLIRQLEGEGRGPVSVYINSMVIRGSEPVIVDTGAPNNREQWLADVFSIVEPADVRWIFLSHDDVDHYGNLEQVLDACPNATFVTNWFIGERMGCAFEAPLHRSRWIEHGQSFVAGDRELLAYRPPAFDSPTTRGLFDPTTGVYWASDAFASPMLTPVTDVAELDQGFWEASVPMFAQYLSPWLGLVDDAKFQRSVNRVASLRASTIVGCHTPIVRGRHVEHVIDLTRCAPGAVVPEQPDQAVLEEIQRGLHQSEFVKLG